MDNEVLFGADLAMYREFDADSIKYGLNSSYLAEILRRVPTSVVPAIAKMFMLWSGAMDRVTRRVQALVNTRIQCRSDDEKSKREHQDGIDWGVSSSRTKEQAQSSRIK